MLTLTVISAIGLWCYYRPVPTEEPVVGGGKAIFHFKNIESEDGEDDLKVRHGHYVLLNKANQVEVRGYYNDGVPDGTWHYYFANGRKKMSGQCSMGARTGVWYRWNENGVCVGQVTFGKPTKISEKSEEYYISKRQGSTQQWWDNGATKAKGEYVNDRRHGQWEFKNADGELKASGGYLDGRRQGEWQLLDETSKSLRTVLVINNREYSEIERHLSELREAFSQSNPTTAA
ncbi:MAG: antitoxin component YwqK of YwqJK toxin-antitoxin module, partial [Pirellulaceae bacterium]